jgi:hypothetical protein
MEPKGALAASVPYAFVFLVSIFYVFNSEITNKALDQAETVDIL